ncbi:MAG: ABC transporter ATP-binding protein [Chloroflexota bacterium]
MPHSRTVHQHDAAVTQLSVPTVSRPAAGDGNAIAVSGLRKSYGETPAVDGLTFTIQRGEIFALLGPNGAGKTTTLEILEGYRSRDGGTVDVLGIDPQVDADALKPMIGVMLQSGGIYPSVTPAELLDLLWHFYPDAIEPDALLELVGLQEAADTRYNRLSGGQQRRLALAAAIIGRPKLLFLDEPTAGMDPQARRVTWDLIESQRQQGTTIILTTHFMEEAERLADRVAIIDHGRLLTLERPEALRRNGGSTVRFTGPAGIDTTELDRLPASAGVREVQPGTYIIDTDDPISLLAELTGWAREQGVLLDELRAGHESLEDVFLRLTGHQIRE